MNAEMFLKHVAGVIEHRDREYGDAGAQLEQIARRWSLTLGHKVTPAQVALCLIDVKLTRLARNPRHLDSAVDLAGYAALLGEVTRHD